MHSFEVHSNESACRKKVRLGLEQVNNNCSGVIILDSIFGLRPTHIDKVLTKLDHGFGAYEEAINFGFGSRGHDKIDYLGDSDHRAISSRDRSVFGEYNVGTSATSGFDDIEVDSI